MKKIILSLVAISLFAAISAQKPHWLDPAVVSIGKELPRGDVVSHDTKDEAIRKSYHKSQYLQPLVEWTKTVRDDAVAYKTRYKIPFAWIDREIFLYLNKVSTSFDVIINGEPAGYSQTGSTPSEFDITKISREGNNDLEIVIYKEPAALKLENSRTSVEPQIQGEVYLLSQPKMRVRDIFLNTRTEGTNGLLEFGVIMKSHQLNVKNYKIYYELISPKGEILAEGNKEALLDMRREDTVRFFAKIPNIMPWSHEEPRLYTLFIKTQHEGRYKEYMSFQVGFRSLDFKNGLIHLNNTPLKITMREFVPTTDMAEMRSRIEALRAEGVNTLKLKGAPPTHQFYGLCDEMGVYICNQADIDTHLSDPSRKTGGNPSNEPEWEASYRDRVMNMYHTSKNSTSMIMFSIAEESANGYNLYESYLGLKSVEKHRPVIYTDGGEWNNDLLDFEAMDKIHYHSEEQWAIITPENINSGEFRIHNTRHFTPIMGEVVYKIAVGKKIVSKGSIPIEVMPKGRMDFVIPISNVREGKKITVQIEVKIERPVNKYVLTGQSSETKVFRDTAPVAEKDKIVIERCSFPSVYVPVNVPVNVPSVYVPVNVPSNVRATDVQ